MALERQHSSASLIDVLDRVLDKGVVVDAWVRVSFVGIDLMTANSHFVVTSTQTWLKHSKRRRSGDPQDDDGGPPTGDGGIPAFDGYADMLPRAHSQRHRRPIG